MKIRKGFVSNSSSSSFILISESDVPSSREVMRSSLEDFLERDDVFGDYYPFKEKIGEFLNINYLPRIREERDLKRNIYVPVSIPQEVRYCRSDIAKVTSLKDKIVYLYSLYCYYLVLSRSSQSLTITQILKKIDSARRKIIKLGRKYGYDIYLESFPVNIYLSRDYDSKKREFSKHKHLELSVNVSTECCYSGEVFRMFEDKDTLELERALFNPQSFCVLGGDEYSETFDLGFFSKKDIDKDPYPYHLIADYSEDWGSRVPDYWDNDHIPDSPTLEEIEREFPGTSWEEKWSYSRAQKNLPFNDGYDESII